MKIMVRMLEKVVKDAISGNKYKSGTREVFQSVKGSKLIIVSDSLGKHKKEELDSQAKSAGVPIYKFKGNSLQLGKMCNKPFRITAIAIKSGTDEEISAILKE